MDHDTDGNAYHEASEEIIYDSSTDLLDTIRETQTTFNLFLNNRFELAEERMKFMAHRSIYHATGLNTIKFIKATMTCEKEALEDALESSKAASILIDSRRQKWSVSESISSFGGWTKAKAIAATDEELHAELCYAEVLLFRAALSFFSDESLGSFVKGALKIRSCYNIYKACYKLLEMSAVWENRDLKIKEQFESGVRLGIGCFNLMISCLPGKVLKLLEVVGFSGDKAIAFSELHACAAMEYTLRAHLCCCVLLSWHLIACFFLGVGQPDLSVCEILLRPLTLKYPNGSIILFFRARFHLLKGEVEQSILLYNASISSQDSYRQFHHGCFWELVFAHSFSGEWHIAAAYARKLAKESRWSRTVYLYMLAILFSADNTVDKKARDETVQVLLAKVDRYRSRIAGKSIPMEKFCSRKAARSQRLNSLHFAHLEFIYFWNGFEIIGDRPKLMRPMLEEMEKNWEGVRNNVDINDICLYRFLRGILLWHLGRLGEAEHCLGDVLECEPRLTDASYLIPNAHYELGQIRFVQGKLDEAENYYNAALRYRSYSLENKLHFRLHGAFQKLREARERGTMGGGPFVLPPHSHERPRTS